LWIRRSIKASSPNAGDWKVQSAKGAQAAERRERRRRGTSGKGSEEGKWEVRRRGKRSGRRKR
jgi:hypothetical protein